MALFGTETESIFDTFHKAVRTVWLSAGILGAIATMEVGGNDNGKAELEEDEESLAQRRADIFVSNEEDAEAQDRVGRGLQEFKREIERLCLPVVKRRYQR
jgi:hypothetical protein